MVLSTPATDNDSEQAIDLITSELLAGSARVLWPGVPGAADLEMFHHGQVLSVTITLHNGIHCLPGEADALGDFVNTDLSINPVEVEQRM